MRLTLPVIWSRGGATHAGCLDATEERVTLDSREESFSFVPGSVLALVIDRGPAERLRGLPALRLSLAGGDVVRIASMGGAGSLHQLTALLGGRQPALSGT